MRVRLLGTGAPAGWPEPSCGCASCRAAARQRVVRQPTRALVDDRLLLEPAGAPKPTTGDQVVLAGGPGGRPAGLAAGYEVRWLPAGDRDCVLDLTDAAGHRLLWGPGATPLPGPSLARTRDRAYAAVVLGLELARWGEQIAALRRVDAVVATTALVAVSLGHDNPPPDELDRILAGWGARAGRDGEVLQVGLAGGPSGARGARILVVGGARSGKSAYAEQRLASEPAVTYVATAPPREDDEEWADRVQAHRQRRPAAWRTVETVDVTEHLRDGAVLIDDLGLWLTRVLDEEQAWEGGGDGAVRERCDALVAAWAGCAGPAVLVVPEVGAGVVPATRSGRLFRDLLGALTARLAGASDEVFHVVAGLPQRLR